MLPVNSFYECFLIKKIFAYCMSWGSADLTQEKHSAQNSVYSSTLIFVLLYSNELLFSASNENRMVILFLKTGMVFF